MEKENLEWPSFLNYLEKDPKRAASDFYIFVSTFLKTCPPRQFKSLNYDEKKDCIQEIVVHCIENDFRVLRSYKNVGKPFAAWFYFIARNKILDCIRKSGKEESFETELGWNKSELEAARSSNPGDSLSIKFEQGKTLEVVRTCLALIDEKCRLLLKLAAEEYLPREMVKILGLPDAQAKKISNDLGYCRKKLANLLYEKGFNIEEILK